MIPKELEQTDGEWASSVCLFQLFWDHAMYCTAQVTYTVVNIHTRVARWQNVRKAVTLQGM